MTTIAQLYELQKIDVTWAKVRKRLNELKSLLVESDELKATRERVEQTEAQYQQWHTQQKDAELESQSLIDRTKETEIRLMSGQVRNPKELESLQANLDAMKKQRETVETTAVEALVKSEELSSQLKDARLLLQGVENSWQSSQTAFGEEELKLKRAFLQLKRQRETLAAALTPAALEQYENLRQRKGGIAIAPLQHQSCSACHIQVPTGMISTLRNQESKQVYCPSCGRILYAG